MQEQTLSQSDKSDIKYLISTLGLHRHENTHACTLQTYVHTCAFYFTHILHIHRRTKVTEKDYTKKYVEQYDLNLNMN